MARDLNTNPQAYCAFMNSLIPSDLGVGVDHQQGPHASGPMPWETRPTHPMTWTSGEGQHHRGGPGCRRGRGGFGGDRNPFSRGFHPRDDQNEDVNTAEKDDSPDTMRDATDDAPDPPESIPNPNDHSHHHWHGRRGFDRRRGMPGRFPYGPHHGPGHHHGPPPPPPPPTCPPHPPAYGAPHPPHPPPPPGHPPFDNRQPWLRELFLNHPLAQIWRQTMSGQQYGNQDTNQDGDHFTPPVDVFRTDGGWVLHVAMPGAKKEDLGVHWDAEKSTLFVSGVVHRPGDEAFLQGLVSGERKVGLFKREVKLPPVEASVEQRGDRDELIDDANIAAKLEDGVLVISVPVVEKEWTEVRKVDIE